MEELILVPIVELGCWLYSASSRGLGWWLFSGWGSAGIPVHMVGHLASTAYGGHTSVSAVPSQGAAQRRDLLILFYYLIYYFITTIRYVLSQSSQY